MNDNEKGLDKWHKSLSYGHEAPFFLGVKCRGEFPSKPTSSRYLFTLITFICDGSIASFSLSIVCHDDDDHCKCWIALACSPSDTIKAYI